MKIPLCQVDGAMLKFALDLTRQLNGGIQRDENILVSPVSIYGVLALLHLGARSATKDELSRVLGFCGSDDE